MPEFKLNPAYTPTADQPKAIEAIAEGLDAGEEFVTLLGATGTGKTFTMAGVIERVQRPALVIAHNKTLAAQLCNEFREFFPDNVVEYFVSYYDYYQPEAYVPAAGPLHREGLLDQRRDRPPAPRGDRLAARPPRRGHRRLGLLHLRDRLAGALPPPDAAVQGRRVDRPPRAVPQAGRDAVHPQRDRAHPRHLPRQGRDARDLPGLRRDAPTGSTCSATRSSRSTTSTRSPARSSTTIDHVAVWPASHYATEEETLERAVLEIKAELDERLAWFHERGKELEAHRLLQRTQYDIEMLKELGFTSGIENYSRILDDRPPGSPPHTLIDYFPDDFVVFVDESHQTVPQIGGMYEGDRSRKQTLVDFGFRLPSAMDNRPLKFDEFLPRVGQLVMVSATPGEFERGTSKRIVEQIVRPTGIVDPEVEVRETRNQIDDLMNEVRRRVERQERTLVTTLTKKMAEDLTGYLLEHGFKVRYLHSEVDTLERIQIIRDLRLGEYDVLVGVNLLREGLDLPEVTAGRDPRRRQGGLPARRDLADPDDRPRGPQRQRPGAHVRRQGDRRDAQGDLRDRPPPRDPARLQPRARDHPGDGAEGDLRHRRVPLDGVARRAGPAPPGAATTARR